MKYIILTRSDKINIIQPIIQDYSARELDPIELICIDTYLMVALILLARMVLRTDHSSIFYLPKWIRNEKLNQKGQTVISMQLYK